KSTGDNYTAAEANEVKAVVNGKADALGADDNYVTDAELSVLQATSGANTGDEVVCSSAEINTGTENVKYVSPDALAGSDIGEKHVALSWNGVAVNTATGTNKITFTVPSTWSGTWNLVAVDGFVNTAGTTGTQEYMVYNATDSSNMLSTALTIDSAEKSSSTAATPVVIDTGEDDVVAWDEIQMNCTAVCTTPGKGDLITLTFRKP
ncbi:unnamed protein product, partial [marine sediment metagenome]